MLQSMPVVNGNSNTYTCMIYIQCVYWILEYNIMHANVRKEMWNPRTKTHLQLESSRQYSALTWHPGRADVYETLFAKGASPKSGRWAQLGCSFSWARVHASCRPAVFLQINSIPDLYAVDFRQFIRWQGGCISPFDCDQFSQTVKPLHKYIANAISWNICRVDMYVCI